MIDNRLSVGHLPKDTIVPLKQSADPDAVSKNQAISASPAHLIDKFMHHFLRQSENNDLRLAHRGRKTNRVAKLRFNAIGIENEKDVTPVIADVVENSLLVGIELFRKKFFEPPAHTRPTR